MNREKRLDIFQESGHFSLQRDVLISSVAIKSLLLRPVTSHLDIGKLDQTILAVSSEKVASSKMLWQINFIFILFLKLSSGNLPRFIITIFHDK